MPSRPPRSSSGPFDALTRSAPVLLAFVLSLVVTAFFTRGEPLFEEETAHLFQADTLNRQAFHQPYPVLAPWLSDSGLILHPEAGWISPVPPGHALWLIPGLRIGFPHLMSALAAAGTVFGMMRIGQRLRFPRYLLPLLMLASPYFLFLHGTLLPQTLGMFLSTLFLWSYIRLFQVQGILSGLLCGVIWGALFFIHPWNAALIGLPFGLHWMTLWFRKPGSGVSWGRFILFLLGTLPGVLLLFWFFRELTQNSAELAREVAWHRAHGWLPFQAGGGEALTQTHSMQRGLRLLWRHVRLMDQWLFGTPRFTLLLWFGLAGHGWNRRWSPLLLGVTLLMFFGYVTWPQLDTTLGGPRYQAVMLPFFLLFGALGLNQIWRKLDGLHSLRLFLFLFLGFWGVFSSIEFLREKHGDFQEHLGDWLSVRAALRSRETPILLFYRDPFPDSAHARSVFGANPGGMDTPVLRVRAPLSQRPGIRDAFPARIAYTLEDETHELLPFAESFQDIERPGDNAHLGTGSGRNTPEGRMADSAEHQKGYLFFGWYPFLPPGRYEVRFDLRWEQIRAEAPTRLEVMTDTGQTTLAARDITGGLTTTTLEFYLTEGRQIEPRVIYGGSGTVHLRRVIVRRTGPPEPEPLPTP